MINIKNQKEVKCNACENVLEYGSEGVKIQHIICGPRGLIPIGQAFVFCCDSCHEDYFKDPGCTPNGKRTP